MNKFVLSCENDIWVFIGIVFSLNINTFEQNDLRQNVCTRNTLF